MPLTRFHLRNEYGLGVKELYREPSETEDPKPVLDGVAVAGLVGLLRQLGDLAEFAAEIFHGLQEELTITASKSQKLITRVKRVEAELPPIEKAVLSQTSHIHFAYAPGSNWHARIRNEQNHFIYTYLPRCIMDFYEECREPPHLQLLDKFDAGGPGSCLKRYSDPTFFRKLSGNSDINDEKCRKGRKSCKAKRRKASKSCSQLPFGTSNLNSSDRMKVSLGSRPQQSYPAHTSSTYDMTYKSDLVERSDTPSASQPDKTKIAQSLSELDDKITNTLESNYIEEQTSVLHDDVPGSSTIENNTHRSSSVTWDEKVEIVEPMALNSRVQDVSNLQESRFEFDKLEIVPSVWNSVDDEAVKVNEANFEFDEPDIEPMRLNSWSYEATEVHTTNFQLILDNEPTDQISRSDEILEVYKTSLELDQEMVPVIYDKNQPEDIETETDNFVDALNTIESESEKDLDCQTRREVESYTHVKDNVENKKIVDNNDDHSLQLESPSSSWHDLNRKSLTSLVLSTCEESLQHSPAFLDTSGKKVCAHPNDLAPFQTILSSVKIVSCGTELVSHDENPDSLQQQSDLGALSSESKETRMIAWTDKGTICSPVSEQAPVESCIVNSVTLWTNGGLLGLQPSEPPDLPLKQIDCDVKNDDSQEPSLESDADEIGFSKCLPQISNSGLDGNLTMPIESNQIYLTPSVTHVEPKDPSASESMIISNGTVHTNEDGSFLSGFHHGLLINDFGRAKSIEYEENPSQKTHDYEGTNFKEVTSPANSPPPSPPLEHMKISFQPINNFETFKLKLKYPEGIDHHEENVNVFPSFQLVPEPNHLHHHDVVSDSDDDTFCRSNLCRSDDDLSHLSDSVWESGDSSESLEDMPYDGLHRISYDESISCSGPISDIPILHVMNSFLYQETKISPEQVDLMEAFSMWEPTPDPPPLPPVQWRASNPLSNDIEGSESSPINHLSLFSLSMNPELDKLNNTRTRDMNFITRNKAVDKSVDDKGDVLQQIRTTSLNLRKTGLLTSTPSTNVNLTAILQKANAIRQVVASDGEDIDPRSDT